MRKLLLLFAILLVCAPAGFAQSDYSNWEFFIGYAHERANNGADRLDIRGQAVNPNGSTRRVDFVSGRIPYNGVSTEVVANVTPHIGLVANFSATFANTDFLDSLERTHLPCPRVQISPPRWAALQLPQFVAVHSLRARAVWRGAVPG